MCISYGALSDGELLRVYGFVAPALDNPHNSVSLPTELLRDAYAVRLRAYISAR